MITYIEDKDSIYSDDIVFHLREHNHQFFDPTKDNIPLNVYVYDDLGYLIGAWQTKSSWNWINTTKLFYTHTSVLKHLIHYGFMFYNDTITGIKCFTSVKERLDDFLEIGFNYIGMVKGTPLDGDTYYADLTSLDKNFHPTYTVITSQEIKEEEDKLLQVRITEFNRIHNILDPIDSVSFVARDGDTFAGGIQCDIYRQEMYVHLLVVNKVYRGNDIGTTLMRMAEEEAKKRNLIKISLGTTDFQAKDFYEKLGYKVVFTRKDNPKGYQSYTLEKYI